MSNPFSPNRSDSGMNAQHDPPQQILLSEKPATTKSYKPGSEHALFPYSRDAPFTGSKKSYFPVWLFFLFLLAVPLVILGITNRDKKPKPEKPDKPNKPNKPDKPNIIKPYVNPQQDQKTVKMIILYWLSAALILTIPSFIYAYLLVTLYMGSVLTASLIVGATILLLTLLAYFLGRRMTKKQLNNTFNSGDYSWLFFLILIFYYLLIAVTFSIFEIGVLIVFVVLLLFSGDWLRSDANKRKKEQETE